ncbi:MAG: hypothetical protein ACRD0A_09445 [Acidimicrobiales bacterium]
MSVPPRRTLACLAVLVAGGFSGGCSPGSPDAYCDQAEVMAGDNPAAVFSAWDPANPATTDELSAATDRLHDMADAAPPEIADDAALIAATADELTELLTTLQGEALEAALREREDRFAEVDEASRRVTEYTRSQCGIDLEAPPPTTTAPAGDPTTTELP